MDWLVVGGRKVIVGRGKSFFGVGGNWRLLFWSGGYWLFLFGDGGKSRGKNFIGWWFIGNESCVYLRFRGNLWSGDWGYF